MGLVLGLAASVAMGQAPLRTAVDRSAQYCSGELRTEAVPQDSYIISGEKSLTKVVFSDHELVYINRGSAQGLKVGDEFSVIRPEKELLQQEWFHGQPELLHAMGQLWADLGRIRVTNVGSKVSTAQIVFSCDYMQRGDIILPYIEREQIPLRPNNTAVDPYAPATGKAAMVVSTKRFGQVAGLNSIVYVNLGSAQGAKVGDYMRVFRRQGNMSNVLYQTPGTEYKMLGFGSTPLVYTWGDLPREILGEGIVVRVSGNSATVMITATRREIYAGDYVEIE
jgi:hypothetical protein